MTERHTEKKMNNAETKTSAHKKKKIKQWHEISLNNLSLNEQNTKR